jgi:uncharacterized protein YndB with AHSA1/START domain
VNAKKLELIAEPGKPTIVTRRVVDAPRALVFEAFTNPEHLKRWLGPRSRTLVVCESDLRVGGKYRWVLRAENGHEAHFHGEYREINPPERIVRTFVFDLHPEDVAVETLYLEERDGKTIITTTAVASSVKERDAHLANGMEKGIVEGYERLDDLLASLRAGAVGMKNGAPLHQ